MDRRGFLKLLASGAVGAAVDVDKLLWIPGAKTIFLPPAPAIATPDITLASGFGSLAKGDVITIEGIYEVNPLGRATEHLRQFVVTSDVSPHAPIAIHPSIYAEANRLLDEADSKHLLDRLRKLPATSYQPRRPMPFHKADPRSGWHGRR